MAIIDGLFDHPPVNDAELRERLSRVRRADARELLARSVASGDADPADLEIYTTAFAILRLGPARERLLRLALDDELPLARRFLPLSILGVVDPTSLERVAQHLSPEDLGTLARLSTAQLLAARDDDDVGLVIAGMFEALPFPEAHDSLLEDVETCRRELGIPAVVAYDEILGRDDAAHLRPALLAAVVEEGSDEEADLLARLRNAAPDEDARREFQKALLRVRSRAISPAHATAPEGQAYFGSCDGQSAYVIVASVLNPNGTTRVLDVCIRATSGLRDGFVIPQGRRDKARELVARLSEGAPSRFVPISLGQAAWLVHAAIERTREAVDDLPDDIRGAVRGFKRIPCSGEDRPPTVLPAERASRTALAALLERPEYEASWFFDLGDLSGHGVPAPPHPGKVQRWIRAALPKLDIPEVRGRLAAMARHMAVWHAWGGEPELAALCAAAARDTEERFRDSALARVMLERGARLVGPTGPGARLETPGPYLRQSLKEGFFGDVEAPTGRDLAHLDMTEAAFVLMDAALERLPGEKRPSDSRRRALAYEAGGLFADFVIAAPAASHERFEADVLEAVERICEIEGEDALRVTTDLIQSLVSFIDRICRTCPVYCFGSPDKDAAAVFFRPEAPFVA